MCGEKQKKRYKLPYSCTGITITREERGPDGPVSMETPAILEPAYGGTVADVSSSSPHVSFLLYQNRTKTEANIVVCAQLWRS